MCYARRVRVSLRSVKAQATGVWSCYLFSPQAITHPPKLTCKTGSGQHQHHPRTVRAPAHARACLMIRTGQPHHQISSAKPRLVDWFEILPIGYTQLGSNHRTPSDRINVLNRKVSPQSGQVRICYIKNEPCRTIDQPKMSRI